MLVIVTISAGTRVQSQLLTGTACLLCQLPYLGHLVKPDSRAGDAVIHGSVHPPCPWRLSSSRLWRVLPFPQGSCFFLLPHRPPATKLRFHHCPICPLGGLWGPTLSLASPRDSSHENAFVKPSVPPASGAKSRVHGLGFSSQRPGLLHESSPSLRPDRLTQSPRT